MCNNKKATLIGFQVDDYLNYEGLIVCPQCGGNIFTCDIEESELQKLCNNKEIVVECPHCMADYSVNMNLKVEIIHKCRWCNDEKNISVDRFSPVSGHFTNEHACEYCYGK